ncbi:phenylalanine--tRNA ligase subunit alpha [Atopobacter sp. AH10]|uniref:phenylalanine--tRNA ligase subunit alpha n=1 Tax=Atopobacter sp. AH10 TaxID=2315861 RepID=UPI000EF1B234|nr:phenylalanine--tRNA ligase subunit alpha [Atopobacter sp. AH10]RLK62430.1 phenylalanine--tRNA ligase subunit alpha [Atopobacter sp. AH10]
MDIKEINSHLDLVLAKAEKDLEEVTELKDLQAVKVSYLGKKGPLKAAMKYMKDLSNEEKPLLGQAINKVQEAINEKIEALQVHLEEKALEEALEKDALDVTLPGRKHATGHRHVLVHIMEDIEDLFVEMGYQVVEGYEIESDHYNFEMMNLPKNHPARDMQDTFYITDEVLLRTHTSPVQARTMEAHDFSKGPLKMISPGRVFRRDDDDATHSHQFHQIEGLVVSKDVTLADLKGTLDLLAKELFGYDRATRLRPSYFPFTEPSVEVDVSCFKCGGEGCHVCKGTGWIEILGCGMVHPHVLEMAGVDPKEYQGFAFGIGADRIAMLKYEIEDIRHLYQNDQRFLNQF